MTDTPISDVVPDDFFAAPDPDPDPVPPWPVVILTTPTADTDETAVGTLLPANSDLGEVLGATNPALTHVERLRDVGVRLIEVAVVEEWTPDALRESVPESAADASVLTVAPPIITPADIEQACAIDAVVRPMYSPSPVAVFATPPRSDYDSKQEWFDVLGEVGCLSSSSWVVAHDGLTNDAGEESFYTHLAMFFMANQSRHVEWSGDEYDEDALVKAGVLVRTGEVDD
ncbi:hypothetical protein [Halomarina oriensis]|uniref:Uncharacterized protein n=1 Tax=Halomarina oriensis TaxID=671145 RepID=A0A6B0GNS8_9EURY|nr:hypothetical protein [Halomarina oriensis]MWG36462.1 hypothetical protein [Halomarina oriensis]